VAESLVKRITIPEAKTLIGPLAENNHYLVTFSTLSPQISDYLAKYSGVSNLKDFLSRKAGILCSNASLPATAYATGEVKDNFMGIPQQFAHTRIYTDIDFSFYIDKDYTLLKIFEGWMEYMSSGSNASVKQNEIGYYRRMRYPDTYKVSSMYINKFEKDYKKAIRYRFVNAFPKAMTNIPVTYGPAEVLKVTVSFNYDRYILQG
tara:strand:+ start:448 stop:1062 length:615 start_codon:yes stop_codon:yes gene_type:complete